MNNYCTNCGRKLEKDELVCKECNTPIVDLPYNYDYKSPQEMKKATNLVKNVAYFLGFCVILFFIFCFLKDFVKEAKINGMQNKYIKPYLEENYGDIDYSIKYESSGKCLIDGDCYFDPSLGCDGGTCKPYEYLDKSECTSYYFTVVTEKKEFTITVVYKDKTYSVVEGKNIYGNDKKENEEES